MRLRNRGCGRARARYERAGVRGIISYRRWDCITACLITSRGDGDDTAVTTKSSDETTVDVSVVVVDLLRSPTSPAPGSLSSVGRGNAKPISNNGATRRSALRLPSARLTTSRIRYEWVCGEWVWVCGSTTMLMRSSEIVTISLPLRAIPPSPLVSAPAPSFTAMRSDDRRRYAGGSHPPRT
jgi:hypothetical protein